MPRVTTSTNVTTHTVVTIHGMGNGDENFDDEVTDERTELLGRAAPVPLFDRNREEVGDYSDESWEGSRRSFYDFVKEASGEILRFEEGSVRGSVFTLASATLGAGALSVPFAFKSMGIALGSVLILLCAVTTIFSLRLLTMARTRTGLSSFEEITQRLYGSNAAAFVESCIAVFCFGCSVAYAKTIRDLLTPVLALYHVTQAFPGHDVEKYAMGIIWLFLLLPLSLIRDINKLRYCSLLSVLTILYLAVAIVQHALKNVLSGRITPRWDTLAIWVNVSPLEIISALPIFLFAFTCQMNVFAIADGLARSSDARMNKVTFRAVGLALLVYACIGLAGFMEFGSGACGNILKNYIQEFEDGNLAVVGMYLAVAATIIMSFPLLVQPCRTACDALFNRCLAPSDRHVVFTILISGGGTALSLYVPHINEVFQLLGGTCSSFVCYVLPALFVLRLEIFASRPCMNACAYLLVVVGTLAGVLSTSLTLYGFINPSQAASECS